jgi:WD40 repeat protein
MAALTAVAVRPSTGGHQIVTGSERGVVTLWDQRQPAEPLAITRPHEEHIWELCFARGVQGGGLAPDNTRCFSCSNDGTVAECTLDTRKERGLLGGGGGGSSDSSRGSAMQWSRCDPSPPCTLTAISLRDGCACHSKLR